MFLCRIYNAKETSVYLVCDKFSHKKFIIKESSRIARAILEGEILKSCDHPGIPSLIEMKEDGDTVCLVEEYICGRSLDTMLLKGDRLSVKDICSYLAQLASILAYLHEMKPLPVIYIDLKPEHVMISGGRVCLIDYDCALYVPPSGRAFAKYGGRRYSPPEIINSGTVNEAGDIVKSAAADKDIRELGGGNDAENYSFDVTMDAAGLDAGRYTLYMRITDNASGTMIETGNAEKPDEYGYAVAYLELKAALEYWEDWKAAHYLTWLSY